MELIEPTYNDSKSDPHQETRGVLKASTLAWAKAVSYTHLTLPTICSV